MASLELEGEPKEEVAYVMDMPLDKPTSKPKFHISQVRPNALISGYTIVEKLGEGAYSHVFRARHPTSGEDYALKFIKPEEGGHDLASTTVREIAITKVLKHTNIVEFVHAVLEEDVTIIVFKYHGRHLNDTFCRGTARGHDRKSCSKKHADLQSIKSVMKQLLSGLAYLHAASVIHRDLKPQNIMVDSSFVVRIGDFGLARAYTLPFSVKVDQEIVTRWYRAPELLLGTLGATFTPAIDIWSLGCIFAEIVRGEPLFTGDSEDDQLRRILNLLGQPDEKSWPGVSKFRNFSKLRDLTTTSPQFSSKFRNWYGAWEPARELLLAMLMLDPAQRITAADALRHPFFES